MVPKPGDVAQRDIWWADLGEPIGSVAGFARPVIVIQSDAINASRLTTFLCVPLTSNPRWAMVPWNLPLPASATGLEHDSVAQTGLMFAADETQLIERAGRISQRRLDQLFTRLDIALGRG